jgi:hypothetical protein
MDGKYEIVYNGFVVGNFVLDRIVPTLSSVQTTNLSNTRAVMPFIRRGDSVKFDYTTSEPVWDSNLVLDGTQKVFAEKVTAGCSVLLHTLCNMHKELQACNDAWRNSKTNTSTYQINNWQGGASGVDGIVNPKIELVDYAGNKGSYLSAVQTTPVYTQTPRLATTGSAIDFRLFADSISPDKSDFNTTSWKDGKDGVVADGVNPEADRLAEGRWVIRGNTITFKVKGEKNARAVFVNNGVELIANAVSTNCTTGANTVVNGLVVKFAELCDVSFTYNWTGTGAQNELGEAIDYKNFQFYTIDLSGNTSAYSNNVTVYNDRTGASLFEPTLKTENVKNKEVSITNSTTVTLSGNIEAYNDVEIIGTKPNGSALISNTISILNDSNTLTNTNQSRMVRGGQKINNNGDKVTDIANPYTFEAETLLSTTTPDTTYTVNGNRRVGNQNDGIYTFRMRLIDTAGNRTEWKEVKIERDTVAPAIPEVTLTNTNNQIDIQVIGEKDSKLQYTILKSGVVVSTNTFENFNGDVQMYSIYRMDCGSSYTVNYKQIDEAGNISQEGSKTISSNTCPVYVLDSEGNQIVDGSNLIEYETPVDLLVAGSNSAILVKNGQQELSDNNKAYELQVAMLEVKIYLYKKEVYKCVDAAAEIMRDAAQSANTKKTRVKTSTLQTAYPIYIDTPIDRGYTKNMYDTRSFELRNKVIEKCPYREVGISSPNSDIAREIDSYIMAKLKSEFYTDYYEFAKRASDRQWDAYMTAIKENWLDFAISIIAGIAITAACTAVTVGVGAVACVAIGGIIFDIAFDYSRGKLSIEGIGLSLVGNAIGALIDLKLAGKFFTVISKSGLKYTYISSVKKLTLVRDNIEEIAQGIMHTRLSDVIEIKELNIIGGIRYFSVKLNNPLRKVVSAGINESTREVKLIVENVLDTEILNAVKTVYPSMTSAKVFWKSADQLSRYSGVEIGTGAQTITKLYDSTLKAFLNIDPSDAKKMLKIGYTELIEYDDMIKPLYLKSTANPLNINNPSYLEPRNFNEEIFMRQVRKDPNIASFVPDGLGNTKTLINDPTWSIKGKFYKMQVVAEGNVKMTIHFIAEFNDFGKMIRVDDFKFKGK